MRHERFKTSIGFLILFGFLASFGLLFGGLVLLMESPPPALYLLPFSGVILTALTIVEATMPALEIIDDTLVVRVARMRKALRVPLREIAPYTVERSLLGLTLRPLEGHVRAQGIGELVTMDGRGVNVPARQISAKQRVRLQQLLEEIGRG